MEALSARLLEVQVMVAFTAWPSLTNPKGVSKELARHDLVEWFRRPKIETDKSKLPGFSLARFEGDERARANVVSVSAVVLDDDSGKHDVEATARAWSTFAGVVFSTFSSTPEEPRTRLVLWTSRAMTGDEYTRVWTYVQALAAERGIEIDPAPKDPSRFWFVPAMRPGGVYAHAELHGQPLDVDVILAIVPPRSTAPSSTTSTSAGDEVHAYDGDVEGEERARRTKLYREWLGTTPPCIAGQGGDVQLWRVVQRGAYDFALPTADVLSAIRDVYDRRCIPPWGDELEERVVHKARSAKTTATRPAMPPLPVDLEHLATGASSEEPPPAALPAATTATSPITIEPGFRFVWAADLAKPVPPPRYIIRHFGVAPGRPSLFSGYGGIGKTMIVQALGLHIATGATHCWSLPIASGPVRHFDYEMTLDPTKRRYQRLAFGYDIDLQRAELGVASMPSIYLSDDAAEDALVRAVDGATLAIVDNLAAATATAGEKENESGVRRYLDRLTRVTERTGCCFLVLVHERKAGKDDVGGLQRVRGSSAITDAAGSVISVGAAEGDGVLSITHNKASFGRRADELLLRIEDIGDRIGDEDAPGLVVARIDARPVSEQTERLLGKIRDVLARGPLPTKRAIEDQVHAKRGTAGPAVDVLVARREVVCLPGVGFVLDSAEARTRRVADAVLIPSISTPERLAKAAHVDVEEVHELLKTGGLRRSGSGFMCSFPGNAPAPL